MTNAKSVILATIVSIVLLVVSGFPRIALADTSGAAELVGTVDVSTLPSLTDVPALPTVSIPLLTLPEEPQGVNLPAKQVILDASGSSSFLHVVKSFAGTPGTNPNPCRCSPPDMGLAASAKNEVQMVNLAGTVYDNGGKALKTFALADFWFIPTLGGPLGIGISDPQVLFDTGVNRWYASIIGVYYVNRVYFAVSATSDPLGTWYIYRVIANSGAGSAVSSHTLPDQPYIGYSSDKFLISANDFVFDPTFTADSYFGDQLWVLNKADMLAGNRFVGTDTNSPDSSHFSVRSVQGLSYGTTAYFAENCLTVTPLVLTSLCPFPPVLSTGGGINVFTITSTPAPCGSLSSCPATTTTFSFTTVPITQTGFPSDADQPGNPGSLATNDNRILSAVWRNNILWTTLNDGNCDLPSCGRVDEIPTPVGPTTTATQDFDLTLGGGSSAAAVFYPSLSADPSNNIVIVFGSSSSTNYPSLYVTGQLSSMPATTLATPLTLAKGTADDLSTRYGDYFWAATNPGQPSSFFVSGEFRKISLFQGWSTQIGLISFSTG